MISKKNNSCRILVLATFIVFILGMLYALIVSSKVDNNEYIQKTNETAQSNSEWVTSKEINDEYIGDIVFESGLVNERVVQAVDNEKYLNISWDLKESSQGAAFMDYRNTLEDQNIIIYAHYVYKDETKMFGPLHQLINQENYEKNKIINLNLENGSRKYEIVYIYYYEMNNPTLEYYHVNYESDYFNVYLEKIKEKSFYETGETITMNDKILTLQTCVKDRNDLRLIVVAKEVE